MKKYFFCIAVAIIVILYIVFSIWFKLTVINSDIPDWLKFLVLSGKR